MYRKIVWCYIIILTLLDISLNTKLTAQGKSHGAGLSVHDSLVEGITFNEWGKEAAGAGAAGGGGGLRAPVRLEPAELSFGACALGAAHSATITLINTGNATLHLASVAGTTPDFHASFFDSKTLPPDGNTTFSVVYLGRREGPVSAHLYIHTALGVHKYSVSAEGVASEWGVWPLLGLRVPANASVQPVLTLRNPTDRPVQVSEVYSSAGWVRLSLPAGGAAAAREAWLLPPHSARDIVRLSVAPPAAGPAHHTHTAYVRIKANITGGGLIVGVEARGAAPGEFTDPVQLRLRVRGGRDPRDTFSISVGNSASVGVRLEGAVWARCLPTPPPAPAPAPSPAPATNDKHTSNGVKSDGAHISWLQTQLAPHQDLTSAVELTLNYEKLWAGYINGGSESDSANGGSANGGGSARGGGVGGSAHAGAWCEGAVRVGRATVPYSLRLLPGTLALHPKEIEFITADAAQASRSVSLVATNEFLVPLMVTHLSVPDEIVDNFHILGWSPRLLAAGEAATIARISLRSEDPGLRVDSRLVVHTNASDYTVPFSGYSGKLQMDWEWPTWDNASNVLSIGAVGVSSTRRVRGRVFNPAPRALCLTAARAAPPAALSAPHPAPCIPPGGSLPLVLTVVGAARAGAARGSVWVSTAHATTTAALTVSAHAGRLAAAPLRLHAHAHAPYAWAESPVVIESTMQLRMRVLGASPPPADPALVYTPPPPDTEIGPGRTNVGTVTYKPEKLCEPRCCTGLDMDSPEGSSWLADGLAWENSAEAVRAAARRSDRARLDERLGLYSPASTNVSLHLTTTQVVQIPVTGWVRLRWPRLVASPPGGAGAGWAGLAGVGGASTLRLTVRNPSRSHALLLHAVIGPPPADPPPAVWEGLSTPACESQTQCVHSALAFSLDSWRAGGGGARLWGEGGSSTTEDPVPENIEDDNGTKARERRHSLPLLLLDKDASVELTISFRPSEPSALTAMLYLRNNLTIVEGVQLAGRGAFPSFELGGRRPGAAAPLVLEVSSCGGAVRRVVGARNTGPVMVRLAGFSVAGQPCSQRGFGLAPCAPLALRPNQSAPLALSYTPDYTQAKATATLQIHTDHGTLTFQLTALTPPKLLAQCAAKTPRPPWEPALKAGGSLLAFALLALVLAAGGLDAERLLRRARAARAASEPRAPLDLRAVAAAPAPAPPPAPRAPPPKRRKTRKVDPQAESRAFERWRASLRRQDDDDSRSSEDAETEDRAPPGDACADSKYEPDEPAPAPAEGARGSSGDDEAPSSESESSSPPEPDDDEPLLEERDSNRGPSEHEPEPAAETHAKEVAVTHSDNNRSTRRREPEARRSERRADDGLRTRTAKHHARKDKPKRRERAPASPPRRDAPPPPPEPRLTGSVRWGASWSSVVARSAAPPSPPPPRPAHSPPPPPAPPAPLAPPAPAPPRSDNSLFYFNGSAALQPRDYNWRQDGSFNNASDFLDEPVSNVGNVGGVSGMNVGNVGSVGSVGGNSYGSIGPVWGSSLEARAPGAAWPWPSYNNTNSGAVRPPPGFGSSPPTAPGPVGSVGVGGVGVGAIGTPAAGARVVRPFDPFHSLAAIWSRNALDWRNDQQEHR